jgi:cytoskeleton protein RodZ
MRGVTLDEISAATRISTRFLQAIEGEQWDQLPGGVFNRGFVRAVARYLGLDEENIVAEYTLAVGDRQTVPVWTGSPPAVTPEQPWLAWIIAAILILVLLAGGWYGVRRFRERRAAKRAAQQTAADIAPTKYINQATDALGAASGIATVSAQSAPAPVSLAAQRFELNVEARKKTNVTVVVDNDVAFDGKMKSGENQTFSATDHFQVSADNAGAVRLELNGKALAPLGPSGKEGKVTLTREAAEGSRGRPSLAPHCAKRFVGGATLERKLALCGERPRSRRKSASRRFVFLPRTADRGARGGRRNFGDAAAEDGDRRAQAQRGAAPEMFAYCAAEFPRRPGVADALAHNTTCPIEVLRPVIRYLSVTAVQELFEDLDRLSTSPALVVALIASAVINAEQRGQLLELQRAEPEPIEAFVEVAEGPYGQGQARNAAAKIVAHARGRARADGAEGRPRRARLADPRSLQSRAARRPAIAAALRAAKWNRSPTWPAQRGNAAPHRGQPQVYEELRNHRAG